MARTLWTGCVSARRVARKFSAASATHSLRPAGKRAGQVRLCFRKGDVRKPLLSTDGTDEFRVEVAAILARLDAIERAKAPKVGTVGGALTAYTKSADFLGLAGSTQTEYQRLIDEIVENVGGVLLQEVTSAWVADLRDAWASRGHRAANLRIQMLINGFRRALIDGRIPADPFVHLTKVKPPHDRAEPNPIWEDGEVDGAVTLALQRGMPGLARAIALRRWAGFRRATICKVPVHIRTQGFAADGTSYRRLYWITEKRRVLCDKPEDPRLTGLLESTPNRALTIAYNSRSGAWQERQLNQAVDRLLEKLAKEGRARPNLTLHGLRHTRGVELAEAGASDSEIMSQLEHVTERTATVYRRQAQRRRLAASAQTKIEAMLAARLRAAGCQEDER